MFSFSFCGHSMAGRLLLSLLILALVCVLTVSGYGLLGSLGLVAIVVIVAADLSSRLVRTQEGV
ncbi:hypothetical protein [Nocardiopsis dassonvillei]|uniref:Uncharacterized protein n=1 Tax=Nocardiopsis dassonvillei (strain ATCC 23218 / DSM 43111 / CIP 107115 / JCM 7437 / KCTC 9190 / NBRC 14626 / NCTC 10488 / NRRL B-5397 / IMRU 509) TaxID=446468 RepID=D7AXZ2_NOCDD|nr:hypothetical protein [Nocardiopsis dassonvillei]ADH69870.1 hypothetical protein Ndas_4482 [Nocardiopsis dassonvillei subsp. dassonvillei DSM 43111]NKY78912.1 hypothetical protein [Nocardiopsis dassonvillei]VEI90383.1 Uncharacterised protein [Nocardiopsis dassonvillei]